MSRRAITGLAIAGVILIAGIISGQQVGRQVQTQPSVAVFPNRVSLFDTALGLVPGASSKFVYGRNTNVSTGIEVLWDAGGDYVFYPTEGIEIDCASTDVDDTALGTGARTITIEALDDNWDSFTENIAMNGTTPVVLVSKARRVTKVFSFTSGTSLANEGTIFCEATVGGGGVPAGDGVPSSDDAAQILPLNGSSLLAGFTVPAGKTGLLINSAYQLGRGDDAEIALTARFNEGLVGNDGSFVLVWIGEGYQNSYTFGLATIRTFPEKTDIQMIASQASGGGTIPVTGFFEIFLFDN